MARRRGKRSAAGGFVAIGIVITLLGLAGYYMMKRAKETPQVQVRPINIVQVP